MLTQEFGRIILLGLGNSQGFLVSHFKREIKKLSNQDYETEELQFNFNEALQVMRDNISKTYESTLRTYIEFSAIDKTVPKANRYNYPKPNIDKIPLLKIKYPNGYLHDLSPMTKQFYLSDLEMVQDALNEVLGTVLGKDDTADLIAREFNFLDKGSRKGCNVFEKEMDYKEFVELLSSYFKHEKIRLPKKVFKLKRATKTKVAKALNLIHRDLGETPLVKDLEFLKIVKTLNHFNNLSNSELYTTLTK